MPPVDELSRTLGAMESTLDSLAVDVASLKRDVAELRATRDRGFGLLIGLAMLSGGAGAFAGKLLSLWK